MKAFRGQTTVEFSMISVVFIGLLLAVIDLSRMGLTQHSLDAGASDLARSLAAISSTNSISSTTAFSATSLNPGAGLAAVEVPTALAHAAGVSNGAISASPALTMTGAMTLTGGPVTVVASPNLTDTTELTVTIQRPFTPTVGIFLRHAVFHLQASSSALTLSGQ